MFIRKISLEAYKVLEDISIDFEATKNHGVFPIISVNGGGKSTLLQIIFTFLHCPFKENRHPYLRTLLEYFKTPKDKDALDNIISFELEHEGEIVNIEFFQCENGYKGFNFNSILEYKKIKEAKKLYEQSKQQIELLNKLEAGLKNSKISTSLALTELKRFIKSDIQEESLLKGELDILKFTNTTKEDVKKSSTKYFMILADEVYIEEKIKKLDNNLQKNDLQYVSHFNENNNVLLYKSNVSQEILSKIADKIYLATPNTQVLHFLNDEQLSSLFSNEKYVYSSYEHHVKECQKDVSGLFTYDFSTINLIIQAYKKARDDDFKKAIKTGEYGSEFKITIEELNNLLHGKSVEINDDLNGVTFKATKSNVPLGPKDLSHGELKKLSIYSWLKAKTSDNSVILMDEVEMGLHPTWQHELYDDLQRWGKGNQFILATHSPQIISKSYYKNLVVLKRTPTGATTEQFNEAPLESDLNTIVKTIMGGEYIPKELAELRKQYRTLFEEGKLESPKAKEIKAQILNYESENSSFFQGLKFEMALL